MSSIIVHGHFYQPPRENPWTGRIDPQPSAAPFHDWNERVHAESYRPNLLANIVTPAGERTVSNYERMSFDVGPTLLAWLEKVHPQTHHGIVAADRASLQRLGRGNALAQAYHHTILPLSPRREIRAEVRWGLADFRYRFGREAEGIWLPETAVNAEVLDVLIEEGLTFTILAPHQAARWRTDGGPWLDASERRIDKRVAYRYTRGDGSGDSIALFFYDGEISRAIAFEHATSSAERMIDLFARRSDRSSGVVHAATDGETYGHHHTFGDIGLAYALHVEAARRGLAVTNYASWLERHTPAHDVDIVPGEGTSWSCAHGVGRWRADCGCHTGGEVGWNQSWRAPLRTALELVKDAVDDAFERLGKELWDDPWEARDHYVDVVIGARTLHDMLAERGQDVSASDASRARALLELQRNAMAMFTSCGWFFSDISGIETLQILRYAARALELLRALGCGPPTAEFLATLDAAKSNNPAVGTGADIFKTVQRD